MPQNLPKISVITVCFNAGDTIVDTINSVLTQTYPFIEYIIIDGGSTDNTQDIVHLFGNKVNLFISEPDTGIYDAMNKGIKNATGDLIIFLNAGDYYISDEVLGYSVGKMHFNIAEVFYGRFIWQNVTTKDISVSDHSSVQYDWDLKKSGFPHPATFYIRNVFSKVGPFDESYKILADYEWNARALVKHRITFQYINIITALFTTEGMSNDTKNSKLIGEERNKIVQQYFQPSWLFDFVLQNLQSDFLKKVIAKIFAKRLNRSW